MTDAVLFRPYDAFLTDRLMARPGLSRVALVDALRDRAHLDAVEAASIVDEYCARHAPQLLKPPEEPMSDAKGCAFVLLFFGILGALGYVTIKVLLTPPPPDTGQPTDLSPGWLVAKAGWSVLLVAGLLYSVVKRRPWEALGVIRRITPLVVAQNVLVLAAVVGTGFLLRAAFPFLDRSWLYLIPGWNSGAMNIVFMPLESRTSTNFRVVALAFLALLAVNLPAMARSEEEDYREGTRDWRHGFRRSVRFGLAHCIVGVPIYVGLALSVGGLWFTHQYFRGGVDRSTLHHTAYNLIVVSTLMLLTLLV